MIRASTHIERHTRVFVALSALFFAPMVLLNVVGLTRFVQLGPLAVAVGVLPYPLTFLVTDLISELYGRSRANFVVLLGLVLNSFVFLVLYIGDLLPAVPASAQPPWQILELAQPVTLPDGQVAEGSVSLFSIIYSCSAGAIFASMLSYMFAQFVDVQIFHYLKQKTQGRHLWLRNNVSTLISQFVDSTVVIGVTFGSLVLAKQMSWGVFAGLLASNYLFKLVAALFDTLPFYFAVHALQKYLGLTETENTSGASPQH